MALRALDEVIALHTLRFHDELVSAADLEIDPGRAKPGRREVDMAGRLLDSLDEDFEPEDYDDTYRESVLALIKRKAAGKEIDLTAQEEPEHGDDLAAASRPASARRGVAEMARALWSGSLSFGLVNVPVQLVSAARDLDFHFHQLHEKDKVRIEQRRFCSDEDAEVSWEEVAHAYDLDEEQVILSDEELASVEPRKTRTIDIEAFVDLADVDPIFYDHPYFLVPAGDSEGTLRAYRLLVEVMEETERAALGRFVMRTKEYLAAVRVRDGALTLTTMLFHDEVRPTEPIPTGGKKPKKREVEQAIAVIEELSTDWDPERYEDCYRERLRRVIESKRKRKKIEAPEQEPEPSPVPDLMAALQRTLDNVRNGRDLRDASEDGDGEGLSDLSRDELEERAKEEKIKGRSKMSKKELVEALSGGE